MTSIPEGFITVSEARKSGDKFISRQAIHQRIRNWELPHVLIGHTTYLEKSAFLASIESGKANNGRPKKKSDS